MSSRFNIRGESDRLAKQRQREREKAAGVVTLTVKLTADEALLYRAARLRQRGSLDDFSARCLTIGACFIANSGNPRGSKLRPIVDMSTAEGKA